MKHQAKDQSASQTTKPNHSVKDLTPRIVGIEEAPAFLIDNKYLIRGYRKNFRSISSIIRSLFMPHNETLNIWTHLLGSLVLVWGLYYLTTLYIPHESVIQHIKLVSTNHEAVGSHLDGLFNRLETCQKPAFNEGLSVMEGSLHEHHLCHYLDAVKSQNFSADFFLAHKTITKNLTDSKQRPSGLSRLAQKILHTVALS